MVWVEESIHLIGGLAILPTIIAINGQLTEDTHMHLAGAQSDPHPISKTGSVGLLQGRTKGLNHRID